MHNQVNQGPPIGQGPHPPMQPAYQRAPPPPPHFQQGPPASHVYPHGPPATSSTVPMNPSIQVPPGVMQNTGQSYAIPSLLHVNSMAPQTFSNPGQNSQHSSNLGFQTHHIPPPVPPPPPGHSHQETSWAAGPSSRVLPTAPPPPSSSQGQILYKPPFHPWPPQPADMQSLQHGQNPPPPPPPSGSGILAPTPDGVYLHSTVGNYQVPSITPPPLPSSPPPVPPLPPPLTPPMTSTSSQAVHSDPNSSKVSGFELKSVDSVHDVCKSGIAPVHRCDIDQDSGSYGKAAIADRDELMSTRNVIMDLPLPPPQPREEKTVQKIEALCQLIAENGPDIEDKICQDDSDMEMEDDITLSDKDHGSNYAIEAPTQQHDQVDGEFSENKSIHQLQNSKENDPAKDILSSDASCFRSLGVSKQHEGPGFLFDLEHMKSARSVTKVYSPVNDATEVAEYPLDTVLEKSAAPLADDFTLGASDLNEVINPDGDSGQLIRSGSPIRLLQNYASDDTSDNEDETCAADSIVLTVSDRAATGVSVAHKDSGSHLETNIGSRSPSDTQKWFKLPSKTSQNDSEISPDPGQEFKGAHERSVSHWTGDGSTEHNLENRVSVNFSASIEAFQGKDGSGGTGIDYGSKSGNTEQEDERKTSKFESNFVKVDEFGRHPREGPTDSDSDDSRYRRTRRPNKRDRSWSRSRSPIDRASRRRRRWRRSPQRRKDRRSRSRSWSPRNRRSRSRSPILRCSGDFGVENVKRDKGQCFDFLRGKCYRGASCRYIHHESDKNASSRRYRNKHDLEVSYCPKNSKANESMKNISSKVSGHEHDRVKKQDVARCHGVTDQEVEQMKEDSVRPAVVSATFVLNDQLVNKDPIKSKSFREVANKVQETLLVREEPKTSVHDNESFQKAVNSHQQQLAGGFHPEALSSSDVFKPFGGTNEDVIPSGDGSSVQKIHSNVSVGVLEHSGYPSQIINSSFVSDSSPDERSITSASKVSSIEPLPYMLPSTQPESATGSVGLWPSLEQPSLYSQASKELPPHSRSLVELPHHTYELPPPAVVSHSQGENAMHMPPISREYGVMQQNAFFPSQSSTREKFEPFPAPLHTQHSHFSVPPNGTWTSLPPPPPSRALYSSSLNAGVAKSFISSEFNQSRLHPRTDFVSQNSVNPGLPSHSQSSEYPPMQDHSRTLMLTETLSPKSLPQGNSASQSRAGPIHGSEDHYKQLSMQDSKFSGSTSFGGLHLQPSLVGRLPPEEHFITSSHIHPVSQKQQPVYNFKYSASEGNLGVPGETVTVSKYPPDVLDSNDSTSLLAFGGSRISAHYNPYASTFEQPLSSRFSSSIFIQENDIIHGNNYGVGSRQTASSPKSARAVGLILPGSGGDQYDPLFDSIEPSSTSLKKFDFDQKQEVTGESNVSLRPKSSYKSLDMEENNKHEEVGAVASTTSQNNDEYGETADAEVGAVENESLSNHVDVANMNTGEVEINQIKSPGKKKKSKDSRSMKLFKISIANFVKEVLKPSWRQGNMSKVAFKTIVKKTVDKVSGAMKGHRVPKSQVKINQYIDSSQRKLTKLVMGYVDKYVKV